MAPAGNFVGNFVANFVEKSDKSPSNSTKFPTKFPTKVADAVIMRTAANFLPPLDFPTLRQHPILKLIDRDGDWHPSRPAAEFWKRFDAGEFTNAPPK